MATHAQSDSDQAVALDERATKLRKMMYQTPGLLDRLEAGRQEAEQGKLVTLREIDQRIAARS